MCYLYISIYHINVFRITNTLLIILLHSVTDGGDFHVGLISDTNGTFRWLSNGRVPTQAEWRNGEPNYGNQIGCTRFAYGAELDDDHCNRNEGYICEIKIVP